MRHLKYAHSYEVVFDLPESLRALRKLALNFRWSWHHETQSLFREADRVLWEEVEHNPIQFINRLGPDRLLRLSEDPLFLAKLQACEADLDRYLTHETWFDRECAEHKDNTLIAYFCAEFGVVESLPIYSGGLGVLAGDHLKAASDLGLPLVGVGLLYSRGYFRQHLNHEGWQQEHYEVYDFYRLPLQLVRGDDEQPLRIDVEFPDRTVSCQVWLAMVGRVKLYLLDSNVLENEPTDQGITDTLYGGDEEMRIRQEMILGIGGMKALRAIGLNPTVCHMNEGHAAFLSVERLRAFMADHQCDFRTARQVVVAGNVFTTHTPVPAGFDLFHPDLLDRYMRKSIEKLGISFSDFLKFGRINPENESENFNMAVLAMETANSINGVSKLHAAVSRDMFGPRWPQYPSDEVPVEAVTNGIHTMTWMSWRMADLLDRYVGPKWRDDPSDPEVWERIAEVTDAELWELRENQRADFVRYCRQRLLKTARRNSMGPQDASSTVLDPRVLTIGFARRFATYKRASLLFADRDRLLSILNHPERPVQFVFAGKAHPRDDAGKALIQEIVRFIRDGGGRSRMVFLEDYDMDLARHLVQGVDVWLNNPRRPMEASGTSGMKVVPNGGLNCSILDGWWAEGYAPGQGWAIGDSTSHSDYGHQDWLDSRALYQLIESEIAPRFYSRNEVGIPTQWLAMMRQSMRELAPRFSTARMVRQYTKQFYLPASSAYQRLQSDGLRRAQEALEWRKRVRAAWPEVRVVQTESTAKIVNRLGHCFEVEVRVKLGALQPGDVQVQTLVGRVGSNREIIDTQIHVLEHQGESDGHHIFRGRIDCQKHGHWGYRSRVVPHHPDVHVPSELALVVWEPDN
ncbi:MAG TPA: alpha-glucan family phosphorylase [Fimbriimonadaceae bacterium]|nr:alpha-glucan family phosphorylase [Fimbriimonadaceae bacterium]HRJ33190.1 alpha-glucan family phosphorylase [Fimbriimonadaceae bacterium]